jgi:hypothetical protein
MLELDFASKMGHLCGMMLKNLSFRIVSLAVALAGWISLAQAEPMIPYPGPSFVSVQTTDPLASEPGNNPGSFTISRSGGTNAALTVPLVFSGTATNGVDYAAIPTNITLAAGQYSSNITVTPISEPNSIGYKTVILTLPRQKLVKSAAAPAFLVGSLDRALVYLVYHYTNLPPSVSLVSPSNGSSFLSKPNIVVGATASDSNGWVTAVQFLANGASLGVVSNYPFGTFPLQPLVMKESHGLVLPTLPGARVSRYQFVWTNVPSGAYALQAVATDNAGLQTTSAVVNITVTTNLPVPQVRIVSPASGAEFPDQAPINLFAAAGETNGVINTVEFFANGNSLGTATNYLAAEPMMPAPAPIRLQWLPYYLQWTNAPIGSNSLTAVATDNNGTKATSAPVTINVTTNLYHRPRPH